MAHEISQRADGFNEVAFVGQTPWHGLGQKVDPNASIEDWKKAAGLDWEVKAGKMKFINGELHDYPGVVALYRSDSNAPLSIVSKDYKVVQPGEILEFYRNLVDAGGFKINTAGVLKGGRKIWALAEIGESACIVGQDKVDGYLLLATACDGTLATTATFVATRVVCANTMRIALSEGQKAVKVSHRSIFNPADVQAELGISTGAFAGFIDKARRLADTPVTDAKAEAFVRNLFKPKFDKETKHQVASPAELAILGLFHGQGMGAKLDGVAGTAWGLLNSVSQFVDHEAPERTFGNRLDSAWFGQGDQLKTKAMELLLA